MTASEILQHPTFLTYAAIIAALLLLQQLLQRLARRRHRQLAERGPRLPAKFGRPDGHFDDPLPENTLPELPPDEPVATATPPSSAPVEPSKPLLRRFDRAEQSDYGSSPLLGNARPKQDPLSKMLDDAFLTTEDRWVDILADRNLPLKQRPSQSEAPEQRETPQS